MSGEVTAKKSWDKFGNFYQSMSMMNKLFLQKKLYPMMMNDSDSVIEHLNALNIVIS